MSTHNKKERHHEAAQSHVHELVGSVNLSQDGDNRHNHRFSAVTKEILIGDVGHRHAFVANTDFFGHFHEVSGETGPAISVGDGKHVHFLAGVTSFNDGHAHKFQFTTFIESPLTE